LSTINVHSSVIGEFGRRLAERMAGLSVGRGTDDGVDVGPLIDDTALRKVQELFADAVDRGATVPTGVPRDAKMADQETFGPVAPLTPFDTDAEALAAAKRHRIRPCLIRFHQRSAAGVTRCRGARNRHGGA
jgi:succinate-semialdehyde dehydrogenase / glutarate-semialdehyde dehydrogenase